LVLRPSIGPSLRQKTRSPKDLLSPLQAIVDVDVARAAGWTPLDLARAYLDGGARLLQIRAKHLASGPLLDVCDGVVQAAAPYNASIVVNDRADLAALSGAAGVHVGQEDLAPAEARRLVGAGAIVGFSTHTFAQIEAAAREPISYLAVGPIFGTITKDTGYSAVGLELVATAARLAGSIPVVAIGGITLETAASVLEAGATSVAVIGDLLAGGNPRQRVAAYLQRLAQHRV
jgi:thiamine-phosphate pyrophosphorylase